MANTPEQQQRNVELHQSDPSVEDILADSQREEDLLSMEQRIKTESNSLASSINQNNTETVNTLSEQQQLVQSIDSLLVKYQDLAKGISSAEGSGATKRHLKHRLNENIESLKRMKNDLDKHNYDNLSTYQSRVAELTYYFEHYEQARQIVVLGGRTSDIHAIIDSKQDARHAKRQENQDARYQSSMNDILHEAALTSLWNNDMERYEEYLEAVLNGEVEPSTHPFYTAHRQSFQLIQATSPDLYGALAPNRRGQITYNTYCQRNPELYQAYCRNNNIVCRPASFNNKIGAGLADMAEKIGLNKDNDPRKRQAREKAGSIAAIGGAVVLGFKFLQSLFSKKHEGKRKEVGLYGAGLLGVLNLDKVTKRAEDITGWHPAEKTRMLAESFQTYGFSDKQAIEMADRYIGAPVTTMTALHFIPIYELENQHILENNNGEIEFNYNNFETYVKKYSWTGDQKSQVLKAGQKLRDDKSVGNGLRAFGIANREGLKSSYGSDKNKTLADIDSVKDGWENMVERMRSGVNAELYNNGLRIKDPDKVDAIMKEYEEKKDNTKISTLILNWMKEGLLEFSESQPYTMDEMLNNPDIDLENMTMKGFRNGANEIKFDSYGDLFYAVHLTDWIKHNFKGRTAVSENPFHIDELTGRIEFDNTEWYQVWKNETAVVKSRTLKKNSSLLNENKAFYVDYLNSWRRGAQNEIIEENKINLVGYPILKEIGINFVDENEANKAETRLKEIKDQLKNYVPGVSGYKPFFIAGNKLGFTTINGQKIYFPDIFANEFEGKSRNLSNFPSILRDKQKFLDYMNNPSNNMRGEQIKSGV